MFEVFFGTGSALKSLCLKKKYVILTQKDLFIFENIKNPESGYPTGNCRF